MLHRCQNVRALFTTHITSPAHSSDQFSAKTRPARTMKKWIAAARLQHHTPHTCWPARSQPVPHPVSSLKSTFCLGSEEQPPHHSKVVHTRWFNTFTSCHLRCQQFSELWAALTLPSRVSKHWRFCLVHCGWQVDQTISESRKRGHQHSAYLFIFTSALILGILFPLTRYLPAFYLFCKSDTVSMWPFLLAAGRSVGPGCWGFEDFSFVDWNKNERVGYLCHLQTYIIV